MYNLGSNRGLSKYSFSIKFAKNSKIFNKNFTILKSKDFFKVSRPNYMIMNCNKFERSYKIKLPNLIDEIKQESKLYLRND